MQSETIRHAPATPASGLAQLRRYHRAWLRADVMAGITVTAYLVPQCLAYASIVGSPPLTSLWVAVVAMVLYALLGTSRLLSVGPEAGASVMVAAAVAPIAGGDPVRWVALSAALAVLVGLACIAAWALRLGFVADLLSRPILLGYMAGLGLVMIIGQLGSLTGVALASPTNQGKVVELAEKLGEVQPIVLGVSLTVVVGLVLLRRVAPLAPGTLIAVIASSVVVLVLGLERDGIALVGPVPSGLPSVSLPAIGIGDLTALLGSAAAVAFVAYSEVALTGRAFAARTGEEIDPNREFLALGVANLAAGLTGGFALSASGSRSAILDAMRARTQLAGLVAAASVVAVVLVVPGLVTLIPKAALAGIVVFAGMHLIRLGQLRRLAKFRSTELGLAVAALVGVLLFDVLAGILVAVGLSVADLFARVARPPASVLGRVPGLAGLHNIEDYPDAEQVPGLLVFRYDAPLCFANAADFRTRALDAVDRQSVPVEWFLLNAEAIVELDTTAVEVLAQFARDLEARRVVFAMARVKQELRAQLVRGELLDVIDEERFYPTLPVAVEAYQRWKERR
ncbi:MAG TPA: sulfate permease [Candidatus Limnocylindrales bacterium]